MTRADTIKYVDSTISASGDGDSWETAYKTLQEALDAAQSTWVIRVAKGTYAPEGTTSAATFSIDVEGVEIYGGYAGLTGGGTPDARDIDGNETILTGLLPSTSPIVYAWHVVTVADNVGDTEGLDNPPTTRLDGFTIKNGNANGGTTDHREDGGGMFIHEGRIFVANCTIINNEADPWGGGVHVLGNSAGDGDGTRFENCTFDNNTALANGGGMEISMARIEVTDCTFSNNTTTADDTDSDGGGGAWVGPGYADNTEPETKFMGCTFRDNLSATKGGGLAVSTGTHQPIEVVNCSFYENEAIDPASSETSGIGGGIWSERPLIMVNVTLSKNACRDEGKGGGIYFDSSSWESTSAATMTNCVLWRNDSNEDHSQESDQIYVQLDDQEIWPAVTYCCIQDNANYTLETLFNTSVNPRFKSLTNNNFILDGTGCDDENCSSFSIDEGSNSPITQTYDIGKRLRKIEREGHGEVVDMGCWETQTAE